MTAKLLTNIDMKYYSFIEKEATERKVTKRSVVERAIEYYMAAQKQDAIRAEYEKMGQDTEYLNEMVENAQYLSPM
jgi:hypothetical protein